MTKKELIGRIRDQESMTWGQATRVVNQIFDEIADELVKGNEVYIPKFGRFRLTSVAKKKCIHPETKKHIITPGYEVIRVRMADDLKRKLKERKR